GIVVRTESPQLPARSGVPQDRAAVRRTRDHEPSIRAEGNARFTPLTKAGAPAVAGTDDWLGAARVGGRGGQPDVPAAAQQDGVFGRLGPAARVDADSGEARLVGLEWLVFEAPLVAYVLAVEGRRRPLGQLQLQEGDLLRRGLSLNGGRADWRLSGRGEEPGQAQRQAKAGAQGKSVPHRGSFGIG